MGDNSTGEFLNEAPARAADLNIDPWKTAVARYVDRDAQREAKDKISEKSKPNLVDVSFPEGSTGVWIGDNVEAAGIEVMPGARINDHSALEKRPVGQVALIGKVKFGGRAEVRPDLASPPTKLVKSPFVHVHGYGDEGVTIAGLQYFQTQKYRGYVYGSSRGRCKIEGDGVEIGGIVGDSKIKGKFIKIDLGCRVDDSKVRGNNITLENGARLFEDSCILNDRPEGKSLINKESSLAATTALNCDLIEGVYIQAKSTECCTLQDCTLKKDSILFLTPAYRSGLIEGVDIQSRPNDGFIHILQDCTLKRGSVLPLTTARNLIEKTHIRPLPAQRHILQECSLKITQTDEEKERNRREPWTDTGKGLVLRGLSYEGPTLTPTDNFSLYTQLAEQGYHFDWQKSTWAYDPSCPRILGCSRQELEARIEMLRVDCQKNIAQASKTAGVYLQDVKAVRLAEDELSIDEEAPQARSGIRLTKQARPSRSSCQAPEGYHFELEPPYELENPPPSGSSNIPPPPAIASPSSPPSMPASVRLAVGECF